MKIIHDTPERDFERLQKIKIDACACAAEYAHCIKNEHFDIALFWLQHMLLDTIIIDAYQDN